MFAVFGGVLLLSAGIQFLFSPLGNAVVLALDAREETLTGVVDVSGEFHKTTPSGVVGLSSVYRLSNPGKAAGLTGRIVRVSGVIHQRSRVLDITCIAPADKSELRP